MAKIKLTRNANWVKYSESLLKDAKVREIFEFYLLRCPYNDTSSMGIDLNEYFKKNKISSDEIKKYLLSKLNLEIDQNFLVAKNLDEMDSKAQKVELYYNFPNKLNRERVVICKKNKGIILSFLYYIRCGLAHGNFLIKNISESKYIILESISKREKCVNARMVIKVESLVKLIKLLLDGEEGYDKYIEDTDLRMIKNAKKILEKNDVKSQKELRKILQTDFKTINKKCQKYKYKIVKKEEKYQILDKNKR